MQKHLGDAAIEYGKQLKAKIKEKYSYYSKLQDEENKGKILRVLNKWYSILESRIQSNEFKSIEEISNDFISLEEKLNETFPNYNVVNYLMILKLKYLLLQDNISPLKQIQKKNFFKNKMNKKSKN